MAVKVLKTVIDDRKRNKQSKMDDLNTKIYTGNTRMVKTLFGNIKYQREYKILTYYCNQWTYEMDHYISGPYWEYTGKDEVNQMKRIFEFKDDSSVEVEEFVNKLNKVSSIKLANVNKKCIAEINYHYVKADTKEVLFISDVTFAGSTTEEVVFKMYVKDIIDVFGEDKCTYCIVRVDL